MKMYVKVDKDVIKRGTKRDVIKRGSGDEVISGILPGSVLKLIFELAI